MVVELKKTTGSVVTNDYPFSGKMGIRTEQVS